MLAVIFLQVLFSIPLLAVACVLAVELRRHWRQKRAHRAEIAAFHARCSDPGIVRPTFAPKHRRGYEAARLAFCAAEVRPQFPEMAAQGPDAPECP